MFGQDLFAIFEAGGFALLGLFTVAVLSTGQARSVLGRVLAGVLAIALGYVIWRFIGTGIIDLSSKAHVVSLAGFGIGVFAGIVMQLTTFCTWGGIYDMLAGQGGSRFRAWLLAMAVAIIAVQGMIYTGVFNLDKAIQLSPNFGWGTAILGGLLFGIGMALARGCGARNLVRLGTGDLKAFVIVLVFGLTAFMTLRGLLVYGTMFINDYATFDFRTIGAQTTNIAELIGVLTPANALLGGIDLKLVVAGVLVLLLVLLTFLSRSFRTSPSHILAGIGVGLAVAAGWYTTAVLGYDDFEEKTIFPLLSLNFVSPVGDTLQYFMAFSGSAINFGIATVLGVPVGSFLASLAQQKFQLAGFDDASDLGRSIFGAILMGFGAVAAFGCTIGQGVSGVATLALGAFVTLFSIILGAVIGYMIRFRKA